MPSRRRSNLPKRRVVAPMFLSLAALLCACDCGSTTPLCETDQAPTACGATCSAVIPCGAGTYCDTDGTCTADCTSAGGQCSADETCDTSGRCQPNSAIDSGSDATDAMFSDVPVFDNICADISATPTRVVPTVVLLVDRSGSMDDAEFSPGVERWDAVQTALIGNGSTDGLIEPLEGIVRFGLTTYSGIDANDDGTPEGACPRVEAFPTNATMPTSPVSAALNNYTPISGAYPGIGELQDETPTGDSIDAVVAALVADANVGRAIIVLATDGEPDRCEDPNPDTNPERDAARQEVYTAVTNAFTNHDIETYVIAVAGEGSVSSDHLRQVANLGQGFPQADVTPRFFRPANVPDLVTALQGIVGGNIPCEVTLNGTVTPDAACSGTVTLNGVPLACTGANGWTFIDNATDNTIRLNGTACMTWRTDPNADLEASFPCDAIIIE